MKAKGLMTAIPLLLLFPIPEELLAENLGACYVYLSA
jgi:hypothetical protein